MTERRAGVPTVRLEVPDYDLGLRGKVVRADKLTASSRPAMCTIVFGLSVADDVTDTPLGSALNGYPDAFMVVDEGTRVTLPWRRGSQAVIADLVHADGAAVQESPRTVLSALEQRFGPLGYEPVLGFEYEVYISRADAGSGAFDPLTRTVSAYSLLRAAECDDLSAEFIDRMNEIGIVVEAFHSELGPGFFEFALAPQTAVRSADNAARARQHLRELCAERGLRATFMAKLHAEHSGSGGHVHQSLRSADGNVFSDGAGALSAPGRHYLAGLLATMGDMSALFNPFLNSYKRLDAAFFVATRSSWGFDNRNAACRVILEGPPSAARLEHRRPGADANPYVVAAGMLAGGLHGLLAGADPGEPLRPGGDVATAGEALPETLAEAVDRLEASTVAKELLGVPFVDAFVATRRGELAAFDSWWRRTITDWELRRYPEHL